MRAAARWSLLVATLALAASVIWRVPLCELLLRQALAQRGWELAALEDLQLGWRGVRIGALGLRLPSGAEHSAHQLALSWRLRGGLSLRVHVARLELTPAPRPQAAAEPSPPVQLPARLLARWWRVPLNALSVERLQWAGQAPVSVRWLRDGEQRRLWLGRDGHRVHVRFMADEGGVLRLTGSWRDGGRQLATLDGRLQPGPTGVDVSARVAAAAAALVRLLPQFDWRAPEGALELELHQLLPPDIARWPAAGWRAALRLHLRASGLAVGTAVLGATEIGLRGALGWVPGELTLSLEPGRWWRSATLAVGGVRLREPALQVQRPASLRWQAGSGALDLTLPAARLALPAVNAALGRLQTELRFDDVTLRRRSGLDALDLRGSVSAGALRARHPRHWLPVLALRGDLVMRGSGLQWRGVLTSDRGRQLAELELRHDLARSVGQAHLNTGLQRFGADRDSLAGAFAGWPWPLDLRAGTSSTELALAWAPRRGRVQASGRFRQQLEGVGGYYGEVGFIGLDAAIAGEFIAPDYLVVADGATVSLASLDVGVPLENIRLAARGRIGAPWGGEADRRTLHLQRLEAGLFGGRARVGEAWWRSGRPAQRIGVKFEGLRLLDMLDALGIGAVRASGTLRGELPLRIEGGSVAVHGGRIGAEPPGGVVRYIAPPSADRSDALTGLVQQALANYHYRKLEGDVDYSHDGELRLRLRLDGHNPDLRGGQPIRLNLSLEDNVPVLLRSLRAGRKIEELVDRRVRAGR